MVVWINKDLLRIFMFGMRDVKKGKSGVCILWIYCLEGKKKCIYVMLEYYNLYNVV